MKNEHWIIYRNQRDPDCMHIVAVCHTSDEAQVALDNAAGEEAKQANTLRKTLFENGQSCGCEVDARNFAYRYVTAHVKGTT